MELLPAIAEERRRLADILDQLTAAQWEHLSLCEGWTNRHVAAHLSMGFNVSLPRMVLAMVKARGNFNRVADGYARREALKPTIELVDCIRRNADHTFKPPGSTHSAPLTDVMIHTLDICRPLGIDANPNPAHWPIVLDLLIAKKTQKFFNADHDGVTFTTTDIDWSAGAGPTVMGAAADIALVLAQRHIDHGSLTGDGVAKLR